MRVSNPIAPLAFAAAIAIGVLALPGAASAQFELPGRQSRQQTADDVSKVRVLLDRDAVGPSETFHLVVLFEMNPKWHVYWKNPGEGAAAPDVRVNQPDGFKVGEIRWPRPKVLGSPVGDLYCYEGRAALFVPVTTPARLSEGEASFMVDLTYAVCSDEKCYLGRKSLPVSVRTSAKAQDGKPGEGGTMIEEQRKRLAVNVKEADDATADLSGRGESRRLTISGPAHGQTEAVFLPFRSPGVRYSKPSVSFENDRFTVVVELTLNPRNYTSKGPPEVGGLVALGKKPDLPSYEASFPLASQEQATAR